jgi:hypothetical protein
MRITRRSKKRMVPIHKKENPQIAKEIWSKMKMRANVENKATTHIRAKTTGSAK